MSLPVIFHPDAERDLDALETYLADRFSARNARAYIQRIIVACHAIGHAPGRGKKLDNVRPGLRLTGFERRIAITFQVEEDHVLIAGIFYGGQTPR